jgi:hypothetical protein
MKGPVHDYLTAHRREIIDQLVGWVRLRSVAGLPEHDADLLRSANWLAGTLRDTGFILSSGSGHSEISRRRPAWQISTTTRASSGRASTSSATLVRPPATHPAAPIPTRTQPKEPKAAVIRTPGTAHPRTRETNYLVKRMTTRCYASPISDGGRARQHLHEPPARPSSPTQARRSVVPAIDRRRR